MSEFDNKVWDELVELKVLELQREKAALKQRVAELTRIVNEVDDVLVVNFVGPRKDGDYRKALYDLVSFNIAIHDDPAVSEVTAQRQQKLAELTTERDQYKASVEVLSDNDTVRAIARGVEDVQAGRILPLEVVEAGGWMPHVNALRQRIAYLEREAEGLRRDLSRAQEAAIDLSKQLSEANLRSLLKAASSEPLTKCYCRPGRCLAPIIMGVQMGCIEPKKAAMPREEVDAARDAGGEKS